MLSTRWLGPIVVALLFALPGGCGGGASDGADNEKVCESNCNRQVAANCGTSASYASTCKAGCSTSHKKFPSCTSQMDAVITCLATKVDFICDPNTGNLTMSSLACVGPLHACSQCAAGDSSACNGLSTSTF